MARNKTGNDYLKEIGKKIGIPDPSQVNKIISAIRNVGPPLGGKVAKDVLTSTITKILSDSEATHKEFFHALRDALAQADDTAIDMILDAQANRGGALSINQIHALLDRAKWQSDENGE